MSHEDEIRAYWSVIGEDELAAHTALARVAVDDIAYLLDRLDALEREVTGHLDDAEHHQAEVADLRGLLAEAADDLATWGGYASEYHQSKWHLTDDIARYREASQPPGPSTVTTSRGLTYDARVCTPTGGTHSFSDANVCIRCGASA